MIDTNFIQHLTCVIHITDIVIFFDIDFDTLFFIFHNTKIYYIVVTYICIIIYYYEKIHFTTFINTFQK